jgi:hypothetical protein
MRNAALSLLPDLIRSCQEVGPPVGIIGILVGVKIFIGISCVERPCVPDCAVRPIRRIRINDVRAVGLQNPFALDRNILRHAQRHRKTLGRAQHGIRNTGVATRGIQQNLACRESPIAPCLANNIGGSPVFHRSARIEPLGLPKDLDLWQISGQGSKSK